MITKNVDIFGVSFHNVGKIEAADRILTVLSDNERICQLIFTPNPEIVMMARDDKQLMHSINSAFLVVPDGVGIVWAAKRFGMPLKERVAGFDMITALFEKSAQQPFTAFFLGGKPGIAQLAAQKVSQKYPSMHVLGAQDGYFKEDETDVIIERINSLAPDILLLGIGAPKQEKWLSTYRQKLQVNAAVGIGGSFDVMAGTVKRAPLLFQKLGLEWFYRLMCEPWRFKRMLVLPKFAVQVLMTRKAVGKKFKS